MSCIKRALSLYPETSHNSFIPSPKWIGSKVGYYFRNDIHGIGYYRDPKVTTTISTTTTTHETNITPTSLTNSKKRTRSVRINEEQNETRTYTVVPTVSTIQPTRINKTSHDNNDSNTSNEVSEEAEQLLKEAEEKVRQQQQMQGGGSIIYDVSNVNSIDVAIKGFTKVVTSNEVVRSQYPDYPTQYMDSEILLYEHIVALKVFGINPGKFFSRKEETFQNEFFSTILLPLLLHPNTDIVEAIISLFLEWFDPIILDDTSIDDEEGNAIEKTAIALGQLISILVQEGALETIVQTLFVSTASDTSTTTTTNDDDDDETDDDQVGNGWKDVIQFIENIIEIESIIQVQYPTVRIVTTKSKSTNNKKSSSSSSSSTLPSLSISAKLVQDTKLLSWLLEQIDTYLAVSKKRNKQSNGSDEQDNYDSIVEKCNRALDILVVISSKEDVYTIIPNWSNIPKVNNMNESDSSTSRTKRSKSEDDDSDNTYDGIELLLLLVAQYKKRQPVDDDELEQLENSALVVASLLLYSSENIVQFIQQLQGIELVYRCCTEQVHAAGVILKWLDFTCSNTTTNQLAYEYIITSNGLKYLFPLFIGKNIPKLYDSITTTTTSTNKRKKEKEWYNTIETTIIRIFYGITRYITDTSPQDAKERFLAKFVPIKTKKDNGDDIFTNTTRCDKLIELFYKYEQKVRVAEYKFYKSDFEETIVITDDENEKEQIIQMALVDAKLNAGGDIYHRLAAIIAFCCAGSTNCHMYIYNQFQTSTTATTNGGTTTSSGSGNKSSGTGTGMTLLYDAITEFITLIPDENITQKQQLESYLQIL